VHGDVFSRDGVVTCWEDIMHIAVCSLSSVRFRYHVIAWQAFFCEDAAMSQLVLSRRGHNPS
jgi:hypothetical protein